MYLICDLDYKYNKYELIFYLMMDSMNKYFLVRFVGFYLDPLCSKMHPSLASEFMILTIFLQSSIPGNMICNVI